MIGEEWWYYIKLKILLSEEKHIKWYICIFTLTQVEQADFRDASIHLYLFFITLKNPGFCFYEDYLIAIIPTSKTLCPLYPLQPQAKYCIKFPSCKLIYCLPGTHGVGAQF